MNRARPSLLLALATLAVTWVPASADDKTPGPLSFFAPSATDDPAIWINPDATPAAFLQPPAPKISAAQEAHIEQVRQQAADDANWLQRGYEEQMRARLKEENAAPETEDEKNQRVETQRIAAEAAGTSLTLVPDTDDLRTSGREQDPSAALRPDAPNAPSGPGRFAHLKPLISTDAPSAILPFAAPSPLAPLKGALNLSTSLNAPLTTDVVLDEKNPDDKPVTDSGDMDIPGMTAAQGSAATRGTLGLPDEELLPGHIPDAPDRPREALQLELPLTRDSDRVARIQSTALALPGELPKAAVAPTAPKIDGSLTAPMSNMVPAPNPLRAHVDDPYQILH